jgi:uncharacterized oxidoreductase
MNLNGKNIFITGGSSGIGFEIAKAAKQAGAHLMICGTNFERLKNAQKTLGECEVFVCDVSKRAEVDGLLAQVADKVDVWVNNAGVFETHNLLKETQTFECLERELMIDFTMPFYISQALLPHFILKESAIVNITSGLAYTPSVLNPMYSAAKAALASFTNSLRFQVQNYPNLHIVEVAPPMVETPMVADLNPKGIKKLSPQVVAQHVIDAILHERTHVYPGMASTIQRLSRLMPKTFLKMLNKEAVTAL